MAMPIPIASVKNGVVLIRGRERLRFLHLHFLITAYELAFTGLGAENFCSADLTLISFSKLTHKCLFEDLFFLFHWLAAAGHRAVASTGHDHFRPALCAFVPLAHLVSHFAFLLYSSISLRSRATRSLGSVID